MSEGRWTGKGTEVVIHRPVKSLRLKMRKLETGMKNLPVHAEESGFSGTTRTANGGNTAMVIAMTLITVKAWYFICWNNSLQISVTKIRMTHSKKCIFRSDIIFLDSKMINTDASSGVKCEIFLRKVSKQRE